jgi:hypothetical protein
MLAVSLRLKVDSRRVTSTCELFVEPSAMVVALSDDLVALCHEVLPIGGLRVHRAQDVFSACRRMTELLPQLVVVSARLRAQALDMIEDRAIAVGAILVHAEAGHGYESIAAQLEAAVHQVRARFSRRTRVADQL